MVSALSRRLLCIALVAVLACIVPPAHAQAGVAGQPLGVCLLADKGQREDELIRHPERFDCTTPQHRFGSGDFWAISDTIDRRSTFATPLALRFASLWQAQQTIHFLYADGAVRSWQSDRRGISPLIQLGAVAELPVPVRDPALVRVLFHVEGAANLRGVATGLRIATHDESEHANLVLAGLYAAFAGMAAALIVYNLALWCAMRHRFQLHYCLLLGALLGYTFTSSGALAWVAPMLANNDRLRLNYLFIGLAGGAAALFTRSFFEDQPMPRWLDRASRIAAMAVPLSALAVALLGAVQLRVADLLYTLAFAGLLAIVVPTLWGAWRQRSHFLWLFAVAWSAPILLAAVRIAAALHFLPWNFWIDNSTILSMGLEALVSSLAVAYRIKFLRDERDAAITREVIARKLADIDPLTGLLNRRAFLQRAIGREEAQQLLLVDIDHFKRVNETLGHDGGDEVLRLFAAALRHAAPEPVLIARMGGEEFALLTPAVQRIEPEALLASLRRIRMPFDMTITSSIGSCTGMLATDLDWKALYRCADSALFEAKAAGRDRARALRLDAA
ncbi:diguanylate cyclase (GGDEF) domain-containing protein [Sphingomonas sp. NFR04]|uniref:GGDEF domain-containing protein n=1 Tax=Sphingomonas sp. NFR04 TaxID=1566283 RepID=UPI0008E31675|nr:diguanylate cyclase [Sphingomonas sp. NFR04]SFJ30113.1 diguanylate cyclase (GGDEF) domain-containing protein [Sphingomonas sp. NFR04]